MEIGPNIGREIECEKTNKLKYCAINKDGKNKDGKTARMMVWD